MLRCVSRRYVDARAYDKFGEQIICSNLPGDVKDVLIITRIRADIHLRSSSRTEFQPH